MKQNIMEIFQAGQESITRVKTEKCYLLKHVLSYSIAVHVGG